MNKGNLQLEDEEEIISAITHALSSISEKELKKSSLARLLCSSYSAVEKIVCLLFLLQPFLQNPHVKC
jgi:transportin-3